MIGFQKALTAAFVTVTALFVDPNAQTGTTGNATDPSPPQQQADPDLIRADIAAHAEELDGRTLYKVTADQLVDLIDEPKRLGEAVAAADSTYSYTQKIERDPDDKSYFRRDSIKTITVLEYNPDAARYFKLIP